MTKNKEKSEFSLIESTALKDLGLASISKPTNYIREDYDDGLNPNKVFKSESGSKEILINDPLNSKLRYEFTPFLRKALDQRGENIELIDLRKVTIINNAYYADGRMAPARFQIDLSVNDLKDLFNECIKNGFNIFPDLLDHILEENSHWLDSSLESINLDETVNKEISRRLNEELTDDTLQKIKNYENKKGNLSDIEYDKFDSRELSKEIKVHRSLLNLYRDITGKYKKTLKINLKQIINGLKTLLPESKKSLITEAKDKIRSNLLASL